MFSTFIFHLGVIKKSRSRPTRGPGTRLSAFKAELSLSFSSNLVHLKKIGTFFSAFLAFRTMKSAADIIVRFWTNLVCRYFLFFSKPLDQSGVINSDIIVLDCPTSGARYAVELSFKPGVKLSSKPDMMIRLTDLAGSSTRTKRISDRTIVSWRGMVNRMSAISTDTI